MLGPLEALAQSAHIVCCRSFACFGLFIPPMTQADILAPLVCRFTKHMAPCTFTILSGDEKRLDTASRKQGAFNLTILGSRQGFAALGVVRDALFMPCLD